VNPGDLVKVVIVRANADCIVSNVPPLPVYAVIVPIVLLMHVPSVCVIDVTAELPLNVNTPLANTIVP